MPEASTPLMRQYNAIKKRYPQALLLFRLGDFYELFYEDAIVAARELQITLTSRHKEKGAAVPMCGVPYHAAESYIAKLIRKGYKVAICEQMEDPRFAKKLVKREVVRVLTPGTAMDTQVLEPKENNFLAACVRDGEAIGLAFLDLSTGEFRATEFRGADSGARLEEELAHLRPRELLYPQPASLFDHPDGFDRAEMTQTHLDEWIFEREHAERLLLEQFGTVTLEGYGLAGHPLAVSAAGAILYYVRETQQAKVGHVDRISFYERHDSLVLDPVSVRNLELLEPLFGGDLETTLLASLDETITPMGARLLKSWLLRPALDREEIAARLDAVSELKEATIPRAEIRRDLGYVHDLERLLSKITLATATARDLLALKRTAERLPDLRTFLSRFTGRRLRELHEAIDELADVRELLARAIAEEPPASLAEPGTIRAGFHAALDELRTLSQNSKQHIARIEARERERTGIASLKVRFNNIFGYYIEVSRPNLDRVPPDYERKQTLVNAERFTTPELKEYESKVLDAEEKILALERQLFGEVRGQVAAQAACIRQTAAALAQLDVVANFAELAAARNYARPAFSDSGEMLIVAGRHPVIERLGERRGERFVPNDLYLNSTSDLILIITGPNMGGKSTYLRQAALIQILAQMGSFVPAREAKLPIVDRIFTRIGASDNLARGRSTFLVEMTEAATILSSATPASLVLLDEVGRGTATFDGLAIAWAVVEYIHAQTCARTLFATHYHELTELAELLPGVKNVHVSVKESGSEIIFLRRVEPGSADRSYGIEVAKLAGLPLEVIERAREVLLRHEQSEHELSEELTPGAKAEAHEQFPIFTPLDREIVDAIRRVDLNQLSPLEALNLLAELRKRLA